MRAFVRRFLIVPVGFRLGRKVYFFDMADNENRAAYVAVSNTVIGISMPGDGLTGQIGNKLGAAAIVLPLGLLSRDAALYIRGLPEVSDPKECDCAGAQRPRRGRGG
jgi:hypothetical protein